MFTFIHFALKIAGNCEGDRVTYTYIEFPQSLKCQPTKLQFMG